MNARRILLDSDAFFCLRGLCILDILCQTNKFAVSLTSFIARTELNDIADTVNQMATSGRISIEKVLVRTPTYLEYKQLLRSGVHKGEAEAIAWICSLPKEQRPAFVSNDVGARTAAVQKGLETGDVMDLLVCIVQLGVLTKHEAQQLTIPWGCHPNAFCRPKDYTIFDTTFCNRQLRQSLTRCVDTDR
jgi:predicted nucleic acid-binding protein